MHCSEELVVITNDTLKQDFRYMIKQKGGLMLAKGPGFRVSSSRKLFSHGLYLKLAERADRLAIKIRNAALENGYKLYYDSYTNQQFFVMSNKTYTELSKKYVFSTEAKPDNDHIAVRICTDWATKEENVDQLIKRYLRYL